MKKVKITYLLKRGERTAAVSIEIEEEPGKVVATITTYNSAVGEDGDGSIKKVEINPFKDSIVVLNM